MVGTVTKYPFFYSFLAGVLSVVFVGALTFGFIFSWRYFRNRRRLEASNNAIPLTTLEGGLKASDASDDSGSSRSPSRLGGLSPSVKGADEAMETQSRFSAQPGKGNGPEDDGPRPVSGISEGSANVVNLNPLTAGVVERSKDRTTGKRAEDGAPGTFWGKNGDTTTERVQPRARIPRLPAVPQTPAARLSISTVWSQESMWPREKRPDVPMPPLPPMPAVAHMAVPRRVMFSPDMGSGSQNRRSTSSLPRSVGLSDFEDYI